MHPDGEVETSGKCAETSEGRLEKFAPVGRADEEAFLRAPVFAEENTVGAGLGVAADHLCKECFDATIELVNIIGFELDIHEKIIEATEFAGNREAKAGEVGEFVLVGDGGKEDTDRLIEGGVGKIRKLIGIELCPIPDSAAVYLAFCGFIGSDASPGIVPFILPELEIAFDMFVAAGMRRGDAGIAEIGVPGIGTEPVMGTEAIGAGKGNRSLYYFA